MYKHIYMYIVLRIHVRACVNWKLKYAAYTLIPYDSLHVPHVPRSDNHIHNYVCSKSAEMNHSFCYPA